MSIDDIISAVRFCIDEEATNEASFANAASGDDTRMNNIIKNKILMVFREINLSYDVKKRDIETRIDTCSAAGLISTVTELENYLSIISTHKQELEQLEREFRADDKASVPLQSYNCGFLRGVATIAMTSPNKKMVMPQVNVPQPFSQQRETA